MRHDVTTKSHKGSPFSWSDPFLLEDQLTEEERMIRDSAAAFAADRLAPRVEAAYLNEETDPEIFREMGASGLLGVTVDEAYGASAPLTSPMGWSRARSSASIRAIARWLRCKARW